jgi:outer membrane protein TolC
MNGPQRIRLWRTGVFLVGFCGGLAVSMAAAPQGPELSTDKQDARLDDRLPAPKRMEDGKKAPPVNKKIESEVLANLPQLPPSILPKEMNSVDLPCVLRLAGIQNPEILIAQQRVVEASALRLFAMAQILPNLNTGGNYDAHTGPVQQSSGNILQVNRDAFYLGAGANAVGSGTVGIPGIWYNLNISQGLFNYLAIRYNVQARQFDNLAVRNQILLQICQAYMDLLRGEGRRAIANQNVLEAREIARLTGVYAKTGLGKQSDADRAAAELAQRNEDLVEAERDMLIASARLAKLLNIPPSVQMHAIDGWIVPTPLIPAPVPLHDLLLIAMGGRPELSARRAEIREAVMNLRNAQFLPFSPTILAGFSAGTFGGGSNLVAQPGGFQGFAASRFGSFAPRDDVDVIMFWTAQNAGLGNLAQIRVRRTQEQIAQLELVRELNIVRNDVAVAYAGIHARYAQMGIAERGIQFGYNAYKEDLTRIMGGQGLPIELLDSFRLTANARYAFLDAIVGYNKAEFAMYVALGQPPAAAMAKAIPQSLVPLPAPAPPLPACVATNGGPCPPPPEPARPPVPGMAPAPVQAAAPVPSKETTPASRVAP